MHSRLRRWLKYTSPPEVSSQHVHPTHAKWSFYSPGLLISGLIPLHSATVPTLPSLWLNSRRHAKSMLIWCGVASEQKVLLLLGISSDPLDWWWCWSARETEADSDNESLMGTFLRGRITRGATEATGSHSCDYGSSQHTFSGAVIILAVVGQSLLCPHCCPHPHPLNRSVEFSLSKGWPWRT